jgi:hypothetical protein
MRGCLNLPDRTGYPVRDILKVVSPPNLLWRVEIRRRQKSRYLQFAPNKVQLKEKFVVYEGLSAFDGNVVGLSQLVQFDPGPNVLMEILKTLFAL